MSAFQRSFGNRGDYDLALGSVYGIRYWRLHAGGYLQGQYGPWVADINEATCLSPANPGTSAAFRAWAKGSGPSVLPDQIATEEAEPEPPHEAPDENCGCGFYAYWREDYCPLNARTPVLGVIEGFGRTLIGDRGFRCARARIVALHLPTSDVMIQEGLSRARDGLDLSIAAEVEIALSDRYAVPVYTSCRLMLAQHPLTTDYIRTQT